MTDKYRVRPVIPRTNDQREIERWQRLTAKRANETTDDLVVDTADLAAHKVDTSTHGVTEIVGAVEAQTLSNKTLTAPTIADYTNANHDHGDADDGGKIPITSLTTVLADANKVIRRDAAGVVVSGNALPNSSALVTTDASQVLTGKTVDGDDNTVQDLALTSLKTVAGDANKVIRRNGSGVVVSDNTVPNSSALLTTDSTQGVSNKTFDNTNKHGGASNYTSFETDGTMVATGGATVWDDSMVPAFDARTAAASLTLATLVGGLSAPRFDLNDEIFGSIQTSHRIKTSGTVVIKPHIHLINLNAIGSVTYNVRFEFEWAWGNIASTGLSTATNDPQTFSFLNASARTHKMFDFTDITAGTGQGGISSLFFFRLKRITAGGATAYDTNDIFFGGFDFHFEIDTMGSREPGSK